MNNGTDNAYKLAKKYKIKTAFGTDTLFDAKLAKRQGAQLAKLVRWYHAGRSARHGNQRECRIAGTFRAP